MNLSQIIEFITKDEDVLFNGCFSERIVRADLSTRREKRNKYIEYYNKFIDDHRTLSNTLQNIDASLAVKSKQCQKEASRLLDIVYSY